jgi:hypothetical protein
MVGVLALASAGCRSESGPELEYRVDVSAPAQGARVTLDVVRPPRDSLVLDAFATSELLGLSQVSATGGDGRALPVRVRFIPSGDGARRFPRIVIPGPPADRVTLKYSVVLGAREGDAHMGYTGRCFGYGDARFAFASGSGLFLVPDPAQAIRRATVRFALPSGWAAVTPWTPVGDAWHPGVDGRSIADDLVGAALGFGHFDEHVLERGSTQVRVAIEAGIPDSARASTLEAIDRVTDYVHDVLRRDAAPRYTIVAVPETPLGDEILEAGWATGHGGTLSPVTPRRLQKLATGLLDGYFANDPFRTVIRDRRERWLGDGVRHLYAWRAVARAGYASEDDIERALAIDYVGSFAEEDVEWNLERAYDGGEVPQRSAEIVAPFATLTLDRELRRATAGRTGLDDLIAKLYAGRVARPLWSSLPAAGDKRWRTYRDHYVRGEEPPVGDSSFTLAATTIDPVPPRGAVTRKMSLAYTGSTYSYLENCGCKISQAGGVARRETMIERIRREGGPVLVLDAGNAFVRPDRPEGPSALTREEQGLYLSVMRDLRYSAAAVGEAELAYGASYFRALSVRAPVTFVAANVRAAGEPLAPAWTRARVADVRFGVIGLFEPERSSRTNEVFERHASDYAFEDPITALTRVLPEARAQSDLVVAMGRLSPYTIRRLTAACPDVDIVISTSPEAANRFEVEGEKPLLQGEDVGGFVGRTLVLYTGIGSYGIGSARIGLDAEKRIASADWFDHWLDDTVSEDSRTRATLTRFYDRVGRTQAAQASVPPLFAHDPARLNGLYVGAAQCSTCHRSEYEQWHSTPHGQAWRTLLDAHRNFQPQCVSCHVVCWGTKSGYKLGDPSSKLVNVQCEICHGPGGEHVRAPSRANITKEVPEGVCLQCHNPDHSDHFVYEDYLPRVVHRPTGGAAAAAHSQPARP